MERETESGPDTSGEVPHTADTVFADTVFADTVFADTVLADTVLPDTVLPEWRAFAGEFPQWHVWRGVAGQYYARVPRTSPPRVVRARNTEDLRREIARAEMARLARSSRSRFKDYCA